MNFFEQELRNMFGSTDIIDSPVYAGRCMLGKLGDDLRVKLQFVTTRIADHYSAIRVDIINKNDGLVDRQTFRMADIIGMRKRKTGDCEPHIWVYNDKPDWYGHIMPSEKAQIADTVLGYVEMYQSPSMTMNGPNM